MKDLTKKVPRKEAAPIYKMPQEVHDWIEQANSLIKYQKTEIAELKLEIKELKAYKAWASKRLTQADYD